jgi:acyl dehydratase
MADTTQTSEDEFAKATDFSFRATDIEKAKSLVGFDSVSGLREQYTTASYDIIRNFARGYGDDNPLFVDEDYGAVTRWGDTIAPPMLGVGLNRPLHGDPVDRDHRFPSFRGIHVFVSGSSWDWYRPVYPGDSLYTFSGIESVQEKKSEFAERSMIVVRRQVRMNQRAEVVAVARVLAIYTERKTAREKGKYLSLEPAHYDDEGIAALDAIYAAERPRGAEIRYWDDVHVGDELPRMAKGPFTLTDIIVFHAGGYGFTPYTPCANRIAYKNRMRIGPFYVKNDQGVPDVAQRVHWDSDWAKAIGNPMAYDYGVLRDCWLGHLLTDWMGDDGWLLRQHTEIRKFNYVGDSHVLTGEVVAKRIEDGQPVVDIEMRGTNQRGVVTCPGRATVALPSRETGPVVLPSPPDDLQRKAIQIMDRHGELLAERRRG